MEQLNKVELIGWVGDIRLNQVADAKVAKISVCTQRAYVAKDGTKVIEDTWHSVSVWATNPDAQAYLARIKKGDRVHVLGRIKVSRYIRQDGTTVTLHEIAAQSVKIVGEDVYPQTNKKEGAR